MGSDYLFSDVESATVVPITTPIATIIGQQACGDIQSIGIYKEKIFASKVSISFKFEASSDEGFEAYGFGNIRYIAILIVIWLISFRRIPRNLSRLLHS